MNRLLIGALLAGALTFPAIAAPLKQGDKAPDFTAKASLNGKELDFSLKDALKKGPVVMYFYPAAFTGGCNAETKAFADSKEKFDAAKTTIIGISGDSLEKLKEYSADPLYCGGKFAMVSDPEGKVGNAFSLRVSTREGPATFKDTRGNLVDNKISTERTTFVIAPDSKIAATFTSEKGAEAVIRPNEHAEKSLAALEALKK